MVAFLVSLIITLVMCGIILVVGRRRPPGTPLTWGEAFVAGTFMFTLMLLMYGVVPNQWLAWSDNELGWRSDSLGIPTPFGRLLEDGLSFGGRGRVIITAQVVRDIIATVIYVVFFAGQIVGWLWWQKKRGRRPAGAPAEIKTSAFGRPLARKA
ncbi:MAG: hypothetical protein M3P85_14865 [Actinomycetota bacterium]|nr:hypothetical protein [Actinomycetota bacterium]PLS75652.1 MAG: hypothetical protein CYG61_06300 [Actinomycetota bacterium]